MLVAAPRDGLLASPSLPARLTCLPRCAVSDEGIFHPEVIAARAAKEAAAVAAWQRNTAAIESLADLHSWLYATHLCYSVSRQHEFGRAQDLDPKLAATY
jgi:hypothetical protein